MKLYSITEYQSFVAEKHIDGYETIPQKTFEQLEKFILTNRSESADALELLSLSAKKSIGKVITAKNYVGVITMNDGTTIEILPKIFAKTFENADAEKVATKKLLVEMIRTLKKTPFKSIQCTNLSIEQLNIFEIFIKMLVDEIFKITKKGIKSDYVQTQSNENFFRGRLNVAKHIKYNFVHKERSYIEYDDYSVNRPENKILKSTLQYLYKKSTSMKNRQDIKLLLNNFQNVESSKNYEGDFNQIVINRNMKEYEVALNWCRVFLQGKSFTSYCGSEVAVALLFPMDALFESYVAAKIVKALDKKEYSVQTQDRKHYLFEIPEKRFPIRPDIVITRKEDGAVFIMDTKWKILSGKYPTYGISQADIYQMYVYQKKYHAKNVTLLYPQAGNVAVNSNIKFHDSDGMEIRCRFIDLFHIDDSISNLLKEQEIDKLMEDAADAIRNREIKVDDFFMLRNVATIDKE